MGLLDEERLKSLYNSSAYDSNTDNWEDGTAKHRYAAFEEALINAGELENIESILDVGCGSGGVLAEAAKQPAFAKAELLGIDVATEAIRLADLLRIKKGVADRVKYRLVGINELETTRRWSVVLLLHVLEHCPDMKEMLTSCLKYSDLAYINVPIEFTPHYALRGGIPSKQFKTFGHLHFFDEEFFLAWLHANDFEVLSKVYSLDFMNYKQGLVGRLHYLVRLAATKIIGPSLTIKWFAGISLGCLVRRRPGHPS